MYLRDEAIVLQNVVWREHDAHVTLFGREHGKMLAIARGARRWQAKHRGHIDALNQIEVMLASGTTHETMAVARSLRARPQLRSLLSVVSVAGQAADRVSRLTEPHAAEPLVFDVLQELLNVCQAQTQEWTAERSRCMLAACTLKLLDALGYAPELEQCHRCHLSMNEDVGFAERPFALVCRACADRTMQTAPSFSLRLIRFLRRRSLTDCLAVTVEIPALRFACDFIESCYREHVPLKDLQERIPCSLLCS